MNIGVIGLGFVGTTNAVCFAKMGHKVMGTDIDINKIKSLARSSSPVAAAGVQELLTQQDVQRNITFTSRVDLLIERSEVILICVGTPEADDGSADISQVERVCNELTDFNVLIDKPKSVILRSTVPIGTCDKLKPTLHNGIQLYHHPEFLREAHAVDDFFSPDILAIGCANAIAVYPVIGKFFTSLYDGLHKVMYVKSPGIYITDFKNSELLKYANNAFHALKIVFANEINAIAEAYGANGIAVMELLCKDTKLNISDKYLKPGAPYGGHCLPKDIFALIHMALNNNASIPMLEGMDASNCLLAQSINTVEN